MTRTVSCHIGDSQLDRTSEANIVAMSQSGSIISVAELNFPTLSCVGELPSGLPRPARHPRADRRPVFTDPSGQRRRLMRLAGAAGSVILVGALVLVGIGLTGGPDTPFSLFSAPHVHGHGHRSRSSGHGTPGRHLPRPAVPSSSSDPSARLRPSASASPTPSPSPSPVPTNKAGKTPPGLSHSPHPHPHPSSHGK